MRVKRKGSEVTRQKTKNKKRKYMKLRNRNKKTGLNI